MKISINGKIVESRDAAISVHDRGYLFGEGVFETLRTYDGRIPFFDKHLARMEWSATFVGIPFPHPGEIKKSLEDLLAVNELPNARIKIILSAKDPSTMRPVAPHENLEVNLVISCEPLEALPASYLKEGIGLCLIRSVVNDSNPLCGVKSLSWGSKMLARRELSEKAAYDGILLNSQGQVTETTTGNLFWVMKGELHTSSSSVGLLGGITRGIALDLAKQNKIPVKEVYAKPEDLQKADEMFMTNSVVGILPVTWFDPMNIGSGKPGPITTQIRKEYEEVLKG
ncbi:MAG TPA: hypothetical protein DDW49_04980 [Deltaproteobacteria bacterium]|nr:MAG: hypothetical protein A2048_00015 [Deltaproteobacteria bacterium GWA2_45_12]HBF12730.1 hypothetical protein [Deltaproteobacteria bacterium]